MLVVVHAVVCENFNWKGVGWVVYGMFFMCFMGRTFVSGLRTKNLNNLKTYKNVFFQKKHTFSQPCSGGEAATAIVTENVSLPNL